MYTGACILRVREHKYIQVLQAYCVRIYIHIMVFNIHVYKPE